ADSLGGLMILLDQMSAPASPLTEMLRTVNETTGMTLTADEAQSPFLRTITERLGRFQYVNRLVTSARDTVDLDKYRAIVRRIREDLEGTVLAARKDDAPKDGEGHAEFDRTLTPAGRAAYAILNQSRDSYMILC